MNIKKIADEISKDWFGPTGQVWCKEQKKYITPSECTKDCPECEALRSPDIKQFRYLHLHDDFKSYLDDMFKYIDGKLIMSQGSRDYYVAEWGDDNKWYKILVNIQNNKVEGIGEWQKCYESEIEKIEDFILSLPANKKISRIADDIIKDWFGPSGDCWCEKLKKNIKPDECAQDCPECQALGRWENRKFRYIQENDYNIGQ